MREVLRPAVAQRKPHPLASDAKMPLRGAGLICRLELPRVEVGPGGEIPRQCAGGGLRRDVAAGVLQQ
jgi:hypothetical protein